MVEADCVPAKRGYGGRGTGIVGYWDFGACATEAFPETVNPITSAGPSIQFRPSALYSTVPCARFLPHRTFCQVLGADCAAVEQPAAIIMAK